MDVTVNKFTTLSIDHEERTDGWQSPTFHGRVDMLEANRVLMCDWQEALNVGAEAMGSVTPTETATVDAPAFIFDPGHRFSLAAQPSGRLNDLDLIADSFEIRPAGKSSGGVGDLGENVASWTKALLDVHYTLAPDDTLQLLVEEAFEPEVEFLTMPHRNLYWNASQTAPLNRDESPGRLVYAAEWTYTIKRLPMVPNMVYDLVGRINSVAMTSPRYERTFAIGTILYGAPDIETGLDWLGQTVFSITMHFAWRKDTWQKLYRAGEDEPQDVYDSGGTLWSQYRDDDAGDETKTLADLLLETA